jgi:hypothetical protein
MAQRTPTLDHHLTPPGEHRIMATEPVTHVALVRPSFDIGFVCLRVSYGDQKSLDVPMSVAALAMLGRATLPLHGQTEDDILKNRDKLLAGD